MKSNSGEAAHLGTLAYLTLSVLATLAFYAVATAMGKYTVVANYFDTAWVFLLTMIVTMPTVAPWVRERIGTPDGGQSHAGMPVA